MEAPCLKSSPHARGACIRSARRLFKNATVAGMAAYQALCAEAEKRLRRFWARLAREHLEWHKPFSKTLDESQAPFYKWFDDGLLNVSYNCLDRNLTNGNAERTAIIFEADDGTVSKLSYRELHQKYVSSPTASNH